MTRWMTLGLALIMCGFLSCAKSTQTTPDSSGGSAKGTDSRPTSADTPTKPAVLPKSTTIMSSEGDWADGDTIPSGNDSIPPIQILKVHRNGSGPACGTGKTATLKYKAMQADGRVLDPGTRPYSFAVGTGNAIKGWHVIVARMRIGDSFTVLLPQDLAYGADKGDLKFDMELLSVQ